MLTHLTRSEKSLLLACLALLLAAFLGPHLAQPAHAHDFADQRSLGVLPCALDVLSNLSFALAGAFGLLVLWRVPTSALDVTQQATAFLFFVGLLLTAAGSTWYHLAPDDAGLAIDRAGMSVAFAGLMGLLAAARISPRSGTALAGALMVLAPASVLVWLQSGNLLPWALVQFGGMGLLLWILATTRAAAGAVRVRWAGVLLLYALAKLFEVQDHAVYAATGELFSGHTVKHVIAAFAAWPVIDALRRQAQRQNGPRPAAMSDESRSLA